MIKEIVKKRLNYTIYYIAGFIVGREAKVWSILWVSLLSSLIYVFVANTLLHYVKLRKAKKND